MEEQHGKRRRKQEKKNSIVLILQEQFCTSELSKVIQDAILLILLLQDNVVIPNGFFKYTCHVGCSINLHSITNSGLSNRQTVFFLPVDPTDKEHKDPNNIDLEAPRLAWYKQKIVEKTSKHGVLGRHQSCSKESIEVLSDAIERHHSSRNTPSLLYPESCSDGIWRHLLRESICVTSTSPKDFLKT